MKKVVKILRGIGYLAAFSLILYPVVSNYINQMNSTTIATDYEQEVSHLSEEQENAMIEQAQEYNGKPDWNWFHSRSIFRKQ